MPSNHKAGLWAEYVAAAFLTLKGYKVLKLRAKTPVGEIDVLAAKGSALIAIEVKTSRKGHATLERVDHFKRERVSRALDWLRVQKNYARYADFRFDVLAIDGFRFYHVRNAW